MKPIEEFSDAELDTVIRGAENTHISGSQYQKAVDERHLRHQKRMLDAVERSPAGIVFGSVVNHGTIQAGRNIVSGGGVAGDHMKVAHNNIESLLSKYWWGFLIPVAVGVVVYAITNGVLPTPFTFGFSNAGESVATSTTSLAAILSRSEDFDTAYEQQAFFKNYEGKPVNVTGTYANFWNSGERYFVLIDVRSERVACVLVDASGDVASRLLLLKKGQQISFVGTFTNAALNGVYREVTECSWLR
jgi:hypothetical protein